MYRECAFRNLDEALDAVERLYPPHLLSPKTSPLVRELLSDLGTGDTDPPENEEG